MAIQINNLRWRRATARSYWPSSGNQTEPPWAVIKTTFDSIYNGRYIKAISISLWPNLKPLSRLIGDGRTLGKGQGVLYVPLWHQFALIYKALFMYWHTGLCLWTPLTPLCPSTQRFADLWYHCAPAYRVLFTSDTTVPLHTEFCLPLILLCPSIQRFGYLWHHCDQAYRVLVTSDTAVTKHK